MARVPLTYVDHTGTGTQGIFDFDFPYLLAGDVFVLVDDVDTHYTFAAGSTHSIQLFPAPDLGAKIRIYRSTEAFDPKHLFNSGVPFLPRYVDENNRQLLYAVQEAIGSTAGDAAAALRIAQAAEALAQSANDKVDAAIIESASKLRQDLADPDLGARLVRFMARPVQARLSDVVNMLDYGPVSTPAETLSTLMAAWTAATLQARALEIPAGKYVVPSIPNLAFRDLTIYAIGRVQFTTQAAGPVAVFGAPVSGYVINFRMLGDFRFEGNSLSTAGITLGALVHSEVEMRVFNCKGAAFTVASGVLTRYKLTASINVGTSAEWAIIPQVGCLAVSRSAGGGDFVSACWFDIRMEGVTGDGFDATDFQQCAVTGTSEHNGGYGIRTRANSRYNSWNQVDLEQNLDSDIACGGVNDSWRNVTCRSNATTVNVQILNTADGNTFTGSDLRCVNNNSGSQRTHFEACRFSDNAALGIRGVLTYTTSRCVRYNVAGVVTSIYTNRLGTRGEGVANLVGDGVAGTNTYSRRVVQYEILSGRVYFDVSLTMTAKDALMSGNMLLTGLPLAAGGYAAGVVAIHGGLVRPTTGYEVLSWSINPGQTALSFRCSGWDVATVAMRANSITATTTMTFSGSYPIADAI